MWLIMEDYALRATQKRTLYMLLMIKDNPSSVDDFIHRYSVEMNEEDIAYVEKKLAAQKK